MKMPATTINGYTLDKLLRDTGLCSSHHATKGGEQLFFKIYRYGAKTSDGKSPNPLNGKVHRDVQERIRKVLEGQGAISEDIIDHFITTLPADKATQPEAYCQVKPWVDAPNVGEHLSKTGEEILAFISKGDDKSMARAQEMLQERLRLGFLMTGLVKVCHEQKLVHQDLKPQQFLAIKMPDGRYRPQICDFDWSFFEGEKPLQNVGTPYYHSREHAAGAARVCKSDVFTMAVILYGMLTLGNFPLYTPKEEGDGLTDGEVLSYIARGKYCTPILNLYVDTFGNDSLNVDNLKALDRLLADAMKPDLSARLSAADLWKGLKDLNDRKLFAVPETKPAPAPKPTPTPKPVPGTKVPGPYFYLRVPESEMFWIVKKAGHCTLTRELAKEIFRNLADGEGDQFHKYVSRDAPILEFEFNDPGWSVRSTGKNKFHLRRSGEGEVEVGSKPVSVHLEDTLVLFSSSKKATIEEFAFVISPS